MASDSAKIMVVENVKALANCLNGPTSPVQVLTAPDGESVMNRLQKEQVDLVIVDTLLRGKMDGFDICRTLKSNAATENIPVILVLTGNLSLERGKGMAAGADLLLHRPVVKEELLRMVQIVTGAKFEQAEKSRPAAPAEGRFQPRLRSVI